MPPAVPNQAENAAGDGGLLALLGGLAIYCVVAALTWEGIRKLLPPRRNRFVSWTAPEVVMVLFLVGAFWPSFATVLVTSTGLGERLYGAEAMARLKEKKDTRDDLAATKEK